MAVIVRPAVSADAEVLSAVRHASISVLCAADHLNDAQRIADWLSNNSPERLRSIIEDPDKLAFVALVEDDAAGFGALSLSEGMVLFNYVAPAHRFQGVSSALLDRMETELAGADHSEVKLTSTVTAQRFYLARGYAYAGEGSQDWGYPMVKTLRPLRHPA